MNRTVLVFVIASLAVACSSTAARVLRVPGAETGTIVGDVTQRGPYLDATLGDLRLFFPDDDTCRALLQTGEKVEYVDSGPLGEVRAKESTCEPIGIGSLAAWRSKRGRGINDAPKPRAQTVSQVMFRDSSTVMLRGRFPLATRARMRGDDIVAVLSADGDCMPEITSGEQTGTMEYRQKGTPVFRVFLGGRSCTIDGFIKPFGLPPQ